MLKNFFCLRMRCSVFCLLAFVISVVRAKVIDINCVSSQKSDVCWVNNLIVLSRNVKVSSVIDNEKSSNYSSLEVMCEEDFKNEIEFLPTHMIQIFGKSMVNYAITDCKGLKILFGDEFSDGHHLQKLEIVNTGLKEIAENSFDALLTLKHLNMENNSLAHINNKLFKNLVNLSFLSLANNKIVLVGDTFLMNCRNLKLAYFEKNPCLNENFKLEIDKNITVEWIHQKLPKSCILLDDNKKWLLGLVAYIIVDITALIVVIIYKRMRKNAKLANEVYVYEGFSFYHAPKQLTSM